MREKVLQWIIFILLSLIWGSSFILMKHGMAALSAYDVAALRILSAGVVLLPFAVRSFKAVPRSSLGWIAASGLLGSFLPAFLFCVAETKIDSSLAGILNALTPLFTLIVAVVIYRVTAGVQKVLGIILGFTGLVMLFLSRGNISLQYISYASLVLLATLFYGININLVSHHLKGQASLMIASIAFTMFIPPSLFILWYNGFFSLPVSQPHYFTSVAASVALGVMGTAVASVLYYVLIKRAGALFASMVTYGIPFVAVGWGLLSGETITLLQVFCLCIILAGVYITSRRKEQ